MMILFFKRAAMNKMYQRSLIVLGGMLFFMAGLGENHLALAAQRKPPVRTARLMHIEDQVLPDRLRVVIQTSQPVTFHHFKLTNPHRLVLDVSPCILDKERPLKISDPKDPRLEGFKFFEFGKKMVRLEFDFAQPPLYEISTLREKPFKILVDFPKAGSPITQPVPAKDKEEVLSPKSLEEYKKDKINQEFKEKESRALFKKTPVNLDFYMMNLHNVLRLIGEAGEKNIIVGDEVKEKKVTLSLKDVPWDEALESLLVANNLKKIIRDGKSIVITTSESYGKLLDDENKRQKENRAGELEELQLEEHRQRIGKDLWKTRSFQIKHVDVADVQTILRDTERRDTSMAPGISGAPPGSAPGVTPGSGTLAGLLPGMGAGGGTPPATGPGIGGLGTVSGAVISRGRSVTLISIPHTNTLVAKGTEKDLDYIADLVRIIDQPMSQVMIEARIVEASANFTRDLGIRWGGIFPFANASGPYAGTIRGGTSDSGNYAVNLPIQTTSTAFGGLGFSFLSTNFNLDARIQAMEKLGHAKTISSPKVLTLDNKQATIKQGSSIPVTTRDQYGTFNTVYKDAALVLGVTPHIANSKLIRIKVEVTKNEPDFTKKDTLGNPAINTKEAKTEMMVQDGDTVVIGGIIFKQEGLTENRVPGLADIPFLGWLFKTRYRTTEDMELLIFITPKILKPSMERFRSAN
jgi:type IV pilus assembly protein PilQ